MTNLLLRFSLLAMGIAILIWLPFEDQSPNVAIILAGFVCFLLSLRAGLRVPPDQRLVLVGIGMAAGVAIAPLAAGLMVFKLGIHAHSIPDFTFNDFRDVLLRTPAFTIAGLFIGVGWYFLGDGDAGQ